MESLLIINFVIGFIACFIPKLFMKIRNNSILLAILVFIVLISQFLFLFYLFLVGFVENDVLSKIVSLTLVWLPLLFFLILFISKTMQNLQLKKTFAFTTIFSAMSFTQPLYYISIFVIDTILK